MTRRTNRKHPPGFPPIRATKHQIDDLVMNHADAEALTAALKKRFPGIRFLAPDYAANWVDVEASRELQRRLMWKDLEEGTYQEADLVWVADDPTGDPLPYLPSLASREYRRVVAWVEPPEWKPRWSKGLTGLYLIENIPACRFSLERTNLDELYFDELETIYTVPDEEWLKIGGWPLICPVVHGNSDQEKFQRQLWRIVEKLTCDEFVAVDEDTYEPIEFLPRPRVYRAGHHVCEWACRRPLNFLDSFWKPLAYYGKDGEDLPPALRQQVAQYRAKSAAAAERRRWLARQRYRAQKKKKKDPSPAK